MKIRLENLSYDYDGQPAIRDVSTTLLRGSFVCLLGQNGSGKTTLLHLLTGQLLPDVGSVSFAHSNDDTIPPRQHRRHFAFLPQDLHDPPYATVRDVVALGRFQPDSGLRWRLDRPDHEMIDACLEQCQMAEFAKRPFSELSGGEKQRAWLAFCLAQDKQFLILDESLHGTDFFVRQTLFQLMSNVAAEGRGVVLTTHDLELASRFADRVLVLRKGSLAYDGTPQQEWNDYVQGNPLGTDA